MDTGEPQHVEYIIRTRLSFDSDTRLFHESGIDASASGSDCHSDRNLLFAITSIQTSY